MTEAAGMPELVNRFRERSSVEERVIPREPVDLLAQAPERDEGDSLRLVRKPEDEVEPLHEDVNVDHAENPCSRCWTGDPAEDDFRVALQSPRMEALRRNGKGLANCDVLPVHGAERHS